MAIAYESVSTEDKGTATTATPVFSGTPAGQMLLVVFGFEGVAPGSGPWVASVSEGGWYRRLYQAPSATGCGLEVWGTHGWSSGTGPTFTFGSSMSFICRGVVYNGTYNAEGVVRATATDQWTGDDPETPSLFAFAGELLITFAVLELQVFPGFTAPSGFTERIDNSRAGFGTVEIDNADKLVAVEGEQGPFTYTASAETSGSKGATAIMAVRPADAPPVATSPMISVEYPAT